MEHTKWKTKIKINVPDSRSFSSFHKHNKLGLQSYCTECVHRSYNET